MRSRDAVDGDFEVGGVMGDAAWCGGADQDAEAVRTTRGVGFDV